MMKKFFKIPVFSQATKVHLHKNLNMPLTQSAITNDKTGETPKTIILRRLSQMHFKFSNGLYSCTC